jgi:hypothetical protein
MRRQMRPVSVEFEAIRDGLGGSEDGGIPPTSVGMAPYYRNTNI